MSINDGGPAFPHKPEIHEPVGDGLTMVTPGDKPGMSLRAYVAVRAMEAMLAGHISHYGYAKVWRFDDITADSVSMADALIDELGKKS